MFKVPFYNGQTYRPIIQKPFEAQDLDDWVDFKDILSAMNEEFIQKYASVDWQKVWVYISENKSKLSSKITLYSWKQVTLEQILGACKYMMPTLWHCDYFSWEIWEWKHHWIDIMLPQNTPLPAFVDWEIVRIKVRDWKSKNEWNCLVLKWSVLIDWQWNQLYFGYEHLQRIDCKVWDIVKQGDIIAYCWSTWNSTQYHLHLQIDYKTAKFHPFWSSSIEDVAKYTIDPIVILRTVLLTDMTKEDPWNNISPPTTQPTIDSAVSWTIAPTVASNNSNVLNDDLVQESEYTKAIDWLFANWLIVSKWNDANPEWKLLRYEFALLMYRILDKFAYFSNKAVINTKIQKYVDIDYWYQELVASVEYLYKYWVMKWTWDKFMPYSNLTWEQCIAVLWRTFYWISDIAGQFWYKPHLDYFQQLWIIKSQENYINKPILRKEIFRILWEVLNDKGLVR